MDVNVLAFQMMYKHELSQSCAEYNAEIIQGINHFTSSVPVAIKANGSILISACVFINTK